MNRSSRTVPAMRAVTEHGEKVRAGQARARDMGIRIGRPKNARLTPEALQRALKMRDAGEKIRDIARALRVPRATLHRALSEATRSLQNEST